MGLGGFSTAAQSSAGPWDIDAHPDNQVSRLPLAIGERLNGMIARLENRLLVLPPSQSEPQGHRRSRR
jgi:hypothetical protein